MHVIRSRPNPWYEFLVSESYLAALGGHGYGETEIAYTAVAFTHAIIYPVFAGGAGVTSGLCCQER